MAQPSAVHYFAPDHPALANTVRMRLKKRIDELTAQMAEGYVSDWADYKERVGVLRGLREAVDISAEIDEELKGRD